MPSVAASPAVPAGCPVPSWGTAAASSSPAAVSGSGTVARWSRAAPSFRASASKVPPRRWTPEAGAATSGSGSSARWSRAAPSFCARASKVPPPRRRMPATGVSLCPASASAAPPSDVSSGCALSATSDAPASPATASVAAWGTSAGSGSGTAARWSRAAPSFSARAAKVPPRRREMAGAAAPLSIGGACLVSSPSGSGAVADFGWPNGEAAGSPASGCADGAGACRAPGPPRAMTAARPPRRGPRTAGAGGRGSPVSGCPAPGAAAITLSSIPSPPVGSTAALRAWSGGRPVGWTGSLQGTC